MKKITEMKLGEVLEDTLFGLMKNPRLLKITYTFQDEEGINADISATHKDYEEEEEE